MAGAGTPNNIDLMLGTCANDGGLFSLILPLPPALSARLFSSSLRGIVPGRDMAKLRRHYRRQMARFNLRAIEEQINNDAFYRMPTIKAAEAHAAAHPGRTYHYELKSRSAIAGLGAIHAIDVALLFRTAPVNRLLRNDDVTQALSDQMLEAWVSFAASGVPRAQGLPQWTPFDSSDRATMILDDTSKLVHDIDESLRRYW